MTFNLTLLAISASALIAQGAVACLLVYRASASAAERLAASGHVRTAMWHVITGSLAVFTAAQLIGLGNSGRDMVLRRRIAARAKGA